MKNTYPRGGISADVIWGKNMRRRGEKVGKCSIKMKKGERKGKRVKRKWEVKE